MVHSQAALYLALCFVAITGPVFGLPMRRTGAQSAEKNSQEWYGQAHTDIDTKRVDMMGRPLRKADHTSIQSKGSSKRGSEIKHVLGKDALIKAKMEETILGIGTSKYDVIGFPIKKATSHPVENTQIFSSSSSQAAPIQDEQHPSPSMPTSTPSGGVFKCFGC